MQPLSESDFHRLRVGDRFATVDENGQERHHVVTAVHDTVDGRQVTVCDPRFYGEGFQ
ncbi:hypothetical protein [Prescottella equi]|uniref:hypothetical protein n=1 Tax=Rhodococcus hoagii TaxID=43767 RepID=UPI0015853069|nr:hypothetical protein [Prescottella equi]